MSLIPTIYESPWRDSRGRDRWVSRYSPWKMLSRIEESMMDMDRQLQWMERDMTNCMRNLGMWGEGPEKDYLGNSGPSTESESGGGGGGGGGEVGKETGEPRKYAMNIHLGGNVKPDDIKVSLKDHVMTVEGKKEFKSEDGNSRLYQEFMRKFTLPERVDMKQVTSVLTPEGYLKIEAPFQHESPLPEPKKAQAIPVKAE